MKKLLILPLLAFLGGCVTYYYPETALEDGVYYAEDDPSYTVYADGYVGAGYYPWYSLDYFYLGYYPYPSYRVTYGYSSGMYFGVGYGFSPWYYPRHYYGYYSPWYASYHHHYYPAWRPYKGYSSHHYGTRHWKGKEHDRHGSDRYAGRSHDDRFDRDDRRRDDYSRQRRGNEQESHRGSSSVRRYVSTAPSGHTGDRGVVVRTRDSAKIGESRLETGSQRSVSPAGQRTANTQTGQPTYSTRRSNSEVRYRTDSKRTNSRTTPVRSTPPPVDVRPANPVQSTHRAGSEVRYRSEAKQTRSRTAPVDATAGSKVGSAVALPRGGVSVAGNGSARPPRTVATRGPAPVRSKPVSGNTNHSQTAPKPGKSNRKAPRASNSSSTDNSGQKSKPHRKDRS